MDRGSNKVGSKLNQEMEQETANLENAKEEGHVEEHLEKERDVSMGEGHRVQGTGSSADTYPLQDHGEIGGDSHPKPKDSDETPRTEREREPKNKP